MTLHLLEDRLRQALEATLRLHAPSLQTAEEEWRRALVWELPKDLTFGDLATSLPFKLASRLRQAPQQIAEALASGLPAQCRQAGIGAWIERAEAKGGFLNVWLSPQALEEILRAIRRRGARFGTGTSRRGESVNIEFVSANPTGPLSVAHGRQAAIGDVLARLLRSQGARVTAEYYLNDEGHQMEMLGRSLRLRYAERLGHPEPFPEDGYHGQYVSDLAEACVKRYGERWLQPPESESLPTFIEIGMRALLGDIRRDLKRFGLRFDRWSSQRWLRTSGRIMDALEALHAQKALYVSEGAMWFASTRYGDDKDRVIRKRDGELTYLAPDIAYHRWKLQRGYDRLVNLWGPDHHGYIARVKAALKALGYAPERLTVRIVQLVTLSRAGRPVPMSKRQGEFVTLREVLDEVGVDATRYFFLMRTMESPLEFDVELAKRQSQENPVYYIQYAHARICGILAKQPRRWWKRLVGSRPERSWLTEPEERALIRRLFQYPVVLRLCADALEPHGLTGYLQRLAETFHVFYTKHRVITEDRRRSAARLELVEATRRVLANGLGMLGIRAPRRM